MEFNIEKVDGVIIDHNAYCMSTIYVKEALRQEHKERKERAREYYKALRSNDLVYFEYKDGMKELDSWGDRLIGLNPFKNTSKLEVD